MSNGWFGFASDNAHGQSPSLQASSWVKHCRQHESSGGRASVDTSGSKSKKLQATDEGLMLEVGGANSSGYGVVGSL